MKNSKLESDSFFTIEGASSKSIKIKNSQFIGYAFPVSTKEDAIGRLRELEKLHYNASHICFAFILGTDSDVFQYSDAGEPNGAAGIRIYNAIKLKNLTNVLVAIVRYFGGTKLGVGPLGKAYSQSVNEVLNQSSIIQKFIYSTYSVKMTYDEFNKLSTLLNEFNLEEIKPIFTENVEVAIQVRKSKCSEFEVRLLNYFRGRTVWQKTNG